MGIGHAARRWGAIVVGLLLLGAGVPCLNYTKPGTLEHHVAWAREHDRPGPNNGIFWAGAGAVMLGAFAIGFGVARRAGAGAGGGAGGG